MSVATLHKQATFDDVPTPTALELERLYWQVEERKNRRAEQRLERPLVRLWDGNYALRGRVEAENSASFKWVLNDTGTGTIELAEDHYLARWVVNYDARTSQNIHITVDKDGARWSGRISYFTVKKDAEKTVVQITFLHDYEEVKWVNCWSNPFLPAAFQFPRLFMLAGPSIWVAKSFLFLNLLRLQGNLWSLPDDPLDFFQWFGAFDPTGENWRIVVKPGGFLSDGSTWAVMGSRWKTWHDLTAATLEDAQLMVTCRRWLTGDPPPWQGADMVHGQLVIDIVDKSAFTTGTSTGGNFFSGLLNTFATFQPNWVDEYVNTVDDPNDPSEYKAPFWLGTVPSTPWVVYREGDHTGIQSSEFTRKNATAAIVNVGGHSMPGVNEAISAAVQTVGDLVTSNIQFYGWGIGAQGGAIDALLRPLYEDTILAFQSVKSLSRTMSTSAKFMGRHHYFEYFQQGADKAYTVSALMVQRIGFQTTDAVTSHKLSVADGAPYFVGENGFGHFFLGDRIGSTIKGMPTGRIYVDRVSAIELKWDRATAPGWEVTIGTDKALERPLDRAFKKLQTVVSDLQSLGVF